jgi:hypothetical protein
VRFGDAVGTVRVVTERARLRRATGSPEVRAALDAFRHIVQALRSIALADTAPEQRAVSRFSTAATSDVDHRHRGAHACRTRVPVSRDPATA